jgi:hypothetical protein
MTQLDARSAATSRLRRTVGLAAIALSIVVQPASAGIAVTSPPPGSGVREGVVFYYETVSAETPLSKFGRAAIVITANQGGAQEDKNVRDARERAAVARIHAAGALAYRYLNLYWMPSGVEYQGLDIGQRPDLAFCRAGTTPLLGRTTGSSINSVRWYFLDLNERATRNYLSSVVLSIRDVWGYDGVFVDRGAAALAGGKDATGSDVWDAISTCTKDPIAGGRTLADAFVAMIGQAKSLGLRVIVNYGSSPYDVGSAPALRPDPRDPHCRAHKWSKCRTLNDVWSKIDYVLDEAPVPSVSSAGSTEYREGSWAIDTLQNQANERDATHPGKVIGLIKNANGSSAAARSREVLYQWARVRLYNLKVAINTGDDGCSAAPSGDVCWRYGDIAGDPWPGLASVELGRPVDKAPFRVACAAGSTTHCIWIRRYEAGMVMLNRSSSTRTSGRVPLALASCRYIYRVAEATFLSPNTCVTSVNRTLGPWTGVILEYDRDGLG